MMTLDAVRELLEGTGNYCWVLQSKDPRITIARHMPSATGEEEGEGEAAKEPPKKKREDAGKLMAESMRQLETSVRIFDESHPGAVFMITYQSSRTAHSGGQHGPIEFTREATKQPSPAAPAQQLAGIPQQPLPPQPSFMDQIQGFVALSGILNQGGNQQNQGLQTLYTERILQLDRREESLNKMDRELRENFRIEKSEWQDKAARELKEEKQRLQEDFERKLEFEREKLGMQRKSIGRRRRELEEAKKNVESTANSFATKVTKTVERAYDNWIADDEDDGGGQQQLAANPQKELPRMAQLAQEIGNSLYKLNDESLAIAVGMLMKIHKSKPEFTAELAKVMREGAHLMGPTMGADSKRSDEEE